MGQGWPYHCRPLPTDDCKQDLLVSQQHIALYCHQLNICSKVKAGVQNHGGALIISGLDSAMSLMSTVKNLRNAIVGMVKACFVASSKYQRSHSTALSNLPAVSWKMKAPE